MGIIEVSIVLLFIIGYILIVLEHRLEMDKAKAALFFGTLTWIFIFIQNHGGDLHSIDMHLDGIILEVAELSLFLMAAMTIVAYLSERDVLLKLVNKILPTEISKVRLLFILGLFTFIFSSVIDNLTATLVSIIILLNIQEIKNNPKDLILFSVFIIFGANAGGVGLITGDLTTLMIFLAGKVEMTDLLYLFIPSFLGFMTLYFLFLSKLKGDVKIVKKNSKIEIIDIQIFSLFLITIVAIILGHVIYHIPPMIIFLFGLSTIFLLSWRHKKRKKEDLKMLHFVHKVEYNAIFFFMGILLMVGSLDYYNMLDKISILYEVMPTYLATFIIGIFSSVLGNIPVTAAMLKSSLPIPDYGWLNMTYAVGVGGSLILIGSAAGIIAMSKCKELTFMAYLKYLPHIFLSYTIGYMGTIAISRFI
ncbi:MAG: sodium:proton antiporter NhaD [Candidatus Gracilibacteria bacterium]|nr:sodium:proton antiporter NhaD [Candidatus Gracilibacteria bacterium]